MAPAPEIWAELESDGLLWHALDHFYEQVLHDDRLAPFFQHVTKQRIVEKQYSFLYSKLAGADVYFGERPRNAHHWMVISDELFNHREALFERCLRESGVSDAAIARIRGIDEAFRKQIVKGAPRVRKLGGTALPLDGFATTEMTVASLCDGCDGAIEVGEFGTYHRRTGLTYCETCACDKDVEPAASI